jgi:hypothetical protein
LEICVPLKLACTVLVDLPYCVIETAVVSFPCQIFWCATHSSFIFKLIYGSRRFKYYRLTALSYIVESLKNDDIHMRLRNESLAMGAIVAYQFNAIIYRPAEERTESVLLEAACQHIADSNGCSYPSLYNQGCYFLSDSNYYDEECRQQWMEQRQSGC